MQLDQIPEKELGDIRQFLDTMAGRFFLSYLGAGKTTTDGSEAQPHQTIFNAGMARGHDAVTERIDALVPVEKQPARKRTTFVT